MKKKKAGILSRKNCRIFLGVDQSRVSEIVHHCVDKVSTDKLLSYNEKINPKNGIQDRTIKVIFVLKLSKFKWDAFRDDEFVFKLGYDIYYGISKSF